LRSIFAAAVQDRLLMSSPALAGREVPGSTQNTKITTHVGVAERGRRVPRRQAQKVRRAKAWLMRQANEHRWIDHGDLIEDCKRHAQRCLLVVETFQQFGGPGAIRTRDTRFRRAVLYPLSYGAIWSRVPVGP
jgi:hypothetical protein